MEIEVLITEQRPCRWCANGNGVASTSSNPLIALLLPPRLSSSDGILGFITPESSSFFLTAIFSGHFRKKSLLGLSTQSAHPGFLTIASIKLAVRNFGYKILMLPYLKWKHDELRLKLSTNNQMQGECGVLFSFGISVRNPLKGARVWLGTYNTAEEASLAFESKRLEFEAMAKALSDERSDFL
ncbi:hypothetical protein VNO80_28911 [Phaseolus coccineus]|uniref:AP2/ERF domain-containing protein n=1 Tax=Phaseolus coccineus TaxID=3886 RepID=A0AAN9QI04_PHACN